MQNKFWKCKTHLFFISYTVLHIFFSIIFAKILADNFVREFNHIIDIAAYCTRLFNFILSYTRNFSESYIWMCQIVSTNKLSSRIHMALWMKPFWRTLAPNSSLDIYHPAFWLAQVCLVFLSLYNALLMCLHSRRHIPIDINDIAFESP